MSYFRYYRLTRAIGAALALLVALGMMWWAGRGGPPERVSVFGTIEEVFQTTAAGDAHRISRVRLEDGREARVTVPLYALKEGRRIPLVIEIYRGGDEAVMFDAERWMESAGN